MQYQEINELLAKGIKKENMTANNLQEIEYANGYLLKPIGNEPVWMKDFLESNRCKLVETICRATSLAEGISSLQGYNEGYFNEIVQNANDLHCGDSIYIRVEKNDSICSVKCTYEDKGFELSNIYAFLNREMSDKTNDDSQTGKFGVGIKSFFKFVVSLKLESNVLFDFDIKRLDNDIKVSGKTSINKEWDGKNTTLGFTYNSNFESGFNVRKLTDFIEYLCGQKHYNPEKSFVSGKDDELVFDARSLIFMMLNSKSKNSISKLLFSGSCHNVEISCSEKKRISTLTMDDQKWKVGTVAVTLNIDNVDKFNQEYIFFGYDQVTFAFPLGEHSEEPNRMYSTYYLKQDNQGQILPMGMLVDSKHSNIHRNDVGNSEETISTVYDKFRQYMHKMYGCMCSKEAAELVCAEEISDIFHRILLRYMFEDINVRSESPLKDDYLNTYYLPKLTLTENYGYIVNHQSEEEYDTNSYKEGDIVQELREHYFDYIERNDVVDCVSLLKNNLCIDGVRYLLQSLYDGDDYGSPDNIRKVCNIVNYFDTVGSFIAFRIIGDRCENIKVSDAEIDSWLIDLRDEIGKYYVPEYFLKLIGRYKLNAAVAYDGSIRYSNLSFKDYLFNGLLEADDGVLAKAQNEQFDEKYFGLKQELLEKRYIDSGNSSNVNSIRCIKPIGRSVGAWGGKYDYYEMKSTPQMSKALKEPELLLEKMAMDDKFDGLRLEGDTLKLFEKAARGMCRREYEFKNSRIIDQQIVNLSCIRKIELDSFSKFINAIKFRTMLDKQYKDYISISCKQENITTLDIVNEILPVMVEVPEGNNKVCLLDEFCPQDVELSSIEENSNNEIRHENSQFIYKTTGYRLHIYHFISNTRRKMIAYFGNGDCAIRTDASTKFRSVATYTSNTKDIFVFYDNFSGDLQSLVTIVLDEIGVSSKKLELLKGYIHNGHNTKTMSYMSRRRNISKVRKKLELDWAQIKSSDVKPIYDNEILYRLLTARGSYDIFCPICADIPLETFDYGEDTKKKHSREIIVLENENPDTEEEFPYIITVACNYCCQRLRSTMSKSEFYGKHLTIITQVAHGMHEKMKSKQQIELSSMNIELMKKFKL